MQGKILIIDAIATNRICLKVKLKKAFYDVVQAASVGEAVTLSRDILPDLILSSLSLPDGDAASLCAELARHPATEHIPILAIGAQPTAEDRINTLAAGVHEVVPQPVDEVLLLGRVRSLIRACMTAAEWRMREDTCRALGLAEAASGFEEQGHYALVGTDAAQLQKFAHKMRAALRAKLSLSSPETLMESLGSGQTPDAFVLILPEETEAALDNLRLIATLRASAAGRHAGLIVLQTVPNPALGANALDLGADDLMTEGFDAAELSLRIKAVMRRKKMGEQLRASVRTGLQAAVFDPLTGLYNRRYAMPHLERIAKHAAATRRAFAVMAADLDHFKRINDLYGHASGDAVLVEVAHRLRQSMRTTDMVARVGGEEFVIIMPGTDLAEAQQAALRICDAISSTPFVVPGSATPIDVTISIGIALGTAPQTTATEEEPVGQRLLDQADKALYAAKGRGRNQVTLGRPAA